MPGLDNPVLAATEAAQRAIGGAKEVPGKQAGRFVLFNAGFSLCSEKCRNVLAETGLAFRNVTVDLGNNYNQNYHPDYVRLRLLAYKELPNGTPLVGEGQYEWSGSSSVSTTGFDPCVVPTLVDLQENKIVVDSKVICEYLVAADPSNTLNGTGKSEESLVSKHLSLVDDTPQVALLYDGNPEHDERPGYLKVLGGTKLHMKQVADLERRLSEPAVKSDPELLRAYTAKLNKTKAGSSRSAAIGNGDDDSYRRAAVQKTKDVLKELEGDLSASSGQWICGDHFTIADLFWGNSIVRLIWLGNEYMWESMPKVKAYAEALSSRDSIEKGVLFHKNGARPSKYWSRLYSAKQGMLSGWWNDRKVDMLTTMIKIAGP